MEEVSVSKKVQFLVASAAWITPVLPKFHNNETGIVITEDEVAWMVALIFPGIIIGSLLSSFIADKFGRRITLLASAAPTIIGRVMIICATKLWMLYITLFLWGIGVGLNITVSGIYLSEIADKEIRGTISVFKRFVFNFGAFLVMMIGPFVSYQCLNYMILVLPLVFVIACWWIPETPYYLLKKGKVEKAKKVLSQLRGFKDKVLEEQLNLMQLHVKIEMRHSGTVKELFTAKQYRRAVIIVFGLKLVQIMGGSMAIMQYLGRIMQDSKTDMQVSTAILIVGGIRFIAAIFPTTLIDRIGRRPLLIYSFTGSGVCLIVISIYFFFQEVVGIENESTNLFRYVPLFGIIIYIINCTIGYDATIVVVISEIFPINVKSKAITAVYIFSGCSSFTVSKGYQVIKDLSGLCGVFLFFGIWSLLGGLFSYLTVQETKGKSLREIQLQLQGISREASLEKLNEGDNLLNKNKAIELKELIVLKINDGDKNDSERKVDNSIKS